MSGESTVATARGSFAIEMSPCPATEAEGGEALARMVLDKRYDGDLVGIGRGQLLSHTTAVDGSAGYVAIEVIEGTLGGRSGSFVIQHFGLMDRGTPELRITVVPDSGAGELAGINGHLDIQNEDGQHRYQLEFSLPDRVPDI